MIRIFLLSLCMAITIFLPNVVGQESDTTTWKGTLDARGTKLRLEIDISQNAGKLTGELRSLDQGNAKLRATEITVDGDTLQFSIQQVGATFSGKYAKNRTVAHGTFSQGGVNLPLTLSKSDPQAATPEKESQDKLKEAWIGKLNMGVVEPVMQFRIVTLESGKTVAYFDSVTEGRTGFEATWSVDGDLLKFDVAKIKLTFRGTLNEVRDTAAGTWSQGGRAFPLTLKKQATEYGHVNSLAEQKSIQQTIDDFDALVEAGVTADGGGCSMIAVFKGDKIIWSKGFGLADVENGIAATANTIGRTGSITKSFTAVVICQLAEQGVFKLDDPVQKHFPEIKQLAKAPANSKLITYRMLASHTAGLVREPNNAGITATGPINLWEEKVLQAIPNTAFKTKPLTEFSYSNIGYGMLGLAGSRAAGQPFMSLVEKQIFEPLAMTSSTFVVETAEMRQRLAVGYIRDRKTKRLNSEVPTRQHAGRGYKVPNGGIYSTVGNMAKFAAAMMGDTNTEILTAQSRKQMFTPQLPAKQYGLGFKITQRNDWKIVGHGGSVAGYRADLRFDLNSKWGVATLATTQFTPPIPKLLIDLVKAVEESPK